MKPEVGMRVNVRSLITDGWRVLYRRLGRPKIVLASIQDINENYLPNEIVDIVHIHSQVTFLTEGADGSMPAARRMAQMVEVVAAPDGTVLE